MASKLNGHANSRSSLSGNVDDKNYIAAESKRITRFASAQKAPGFERDTKLKQMSYDKFSELILFILERVLGHKSRDIMHALASLNYPHKFNKSYLKTPTAEHAYGHMVIMLGWLVDLMEGEHLEYEEAEPVPEPEPEPEEVVEEVQSEIDIVEVEEEPSPELDPLIVIELRNIYKRLTTIEEILKESKMTTKGSKLQSSKKPTPAPIKSPIKSQTISHQEQQMNHKSFEKQFSRQYTNGSDYRGSERIRTPSCDDFIPDDNVFRGSASVSRQVSSISLSIDEAPDLPDKPNYRMMSPEEPMSPKSPRCSFIALEDLPPEDE